MFVMFIAVVAILLIIVGVMSTGATTGSGGVDQTKATKVISEISALAQSTGFYKTTVDSTDYTGLTVQKLIDNGIVASVDVTTPADITVYTLDGASLLNKINAAGAAATDTLQVVKSKAVNGVVYKIVGDGLDVDGDGAADGIIGNNNYFDIEVASETALTSGLKQAIDSAFGKMTADVNGDGTKDVSNTSTTDGSAVIVFN